MSRIGKLPISVPKDVNVKVAGGTITVKGPKGNLSRPVPPNVSVAVRDGEVAVTPVDDNQQSSAYAGLTRSLINNMVIGVSKGFTRELEIHGTGYRCEERKIGGKLWLQFALGFSHPILFEVPDGITVAVNKQNKITLQSADKGLLGQIAANIRDFRKPEPYKGKGIRYLGEHIRRKVGKAGAR